MKIEIDENGYHTAPDGSKWRVVPVEPTDSMKDSARTDHAVWCELSKNGLDSLLEMANDYLSSQKEHRLAPCNPDFLIKHLAINAKRLIEYEKRLLWMADFMANSSNKTVIDVFGECCSPMHVVQNIDDAMANRI